MKLYVMPGACSLASHITCRWLKLPFDLVVLSHDDLTTPEYLRVNSHGAVPALVLDGGRVITQSLAILNYLADSHPQSGLGARQGDLIEAAKLDEALAFLVSDVHKAWAPFFAPNRFVTHDQHHDDTQQTAFVQIDKVYRMLDKAMTGREFYVLDRRTVADAYLYVMCSWKDKTPQPLARYPALEAFKTRLDGDPDVIAALKAEKSS